MRRLVIGLLLLILPAPGAAAQAASGAAAHWSAPAVARVAATGLISPDDPFRPDDPIAEAEWNGWLCGTLAWPETASCRAAGGSAAAPAAMPGPVPGVTRARALAEVVSAAPTVYLPERQLDPADAARPDWPVLQRALVTGLAAGYPDGGLQPDRLLTRAEAAVILGRLLVNRQEAAPWQLEPERQTPLDRLRLLLHPHLAGPHRYLRVLREDGSLLAARVRVADTPVARMVGAESGLGEGLLLMETAAIHTNWGPIPLDVVFLDGDGLVLALHRETPRGALLYHWAAVAALELPGGTIAELGLRTGERLRFAEAAP